MIPKKLHYCWFGKNPKPELVQHCLVSWRKYMPEYEIIEWSEENFDVNQNEFVKTAYTKQKWAFVADFARAKALYENGGFYLDTDMEVRNTLNEFLVHRAVCGFEVKGIPYGAFWGVEKGHPLALDIMNHYLNRSFKEQPNTAIFSRLLVEKYGADPDNDALQELKEGIVLYPSNYFSLDLPKNYVVHHFSGSWHGNWTQKENTYKEMTNMYGILKRLKEQPRGKATIKNVVYNHHLIDINEVLDQIPLRYILAFLKKKFLKK